MVGLDGAGKTTVLYKLKASGRRVQPKETCWWLACWAVGAGCLCAGKCLGRERRAWHAQRVHGHHHAET